MKQRDEDLDFDIVLNFEFTLYKLDLTDWYFDEMHDLINILRK